VNTHRPSAREGGDCYWAEIPTHYEERGNEMSRRYAPTRRLSSVLSMRWSLRLRTKLATLQL